MDSFEWADATPLHVSSSVQFNTEGVAQRSRRSGPQRSGLPQLGRTASVVTIAVELPIGYSHQRGFCAGPQLVSQRSTNHPTSNCNDCLRRLVSVLFGRDDGKRRDKLVRL
jgi:hypothetical protein